MTPEVVIDRYLETASREPFDPTELALLLGTDADLLSRWLQLLSCPADPDTFVRMVAALPPERYHDLVTSQALAVLTVSGSVRLSFDQWQSVLNASLVGELLAREVGLADPVAVRWRVLLAASGVNLPQDPLLAELLAFRGARAELLEDASAIHRLFAVVESLDVTDSASQETAHALLDIPPDRYQSLLALAERQCAELLERLGLSGGSEELDYAERLWLRLQVAMLGRLFPADAAEEDALLEAHGLVCRRLFGRVPELFLRDDEDDRLFRVGGGGPDIRVDSQSSVIARSGRTGQRLELIERADQSVADRQVLRRLGSTGGVCMPLLDGLGNVLGVLVFAVDEDVDQEPAMALYAQELARRISRRILLPGVEGDVMARFLQREEKRLRELVHEAYNPLSIVNNYLHILEQKLAHEPQAVDQLKIIGSEVKRASDIIARIREVPQAEADAAEQPAAEFVNVDLNTLARRVVELHLGYARDHDVTLTEELVAGALLVPSDEQRLAQILNNLVRNAIEAAHGASVTVVTSRGIYRGGREGVAVEVVDTGPGLPREVLIRLAEPKQTTKGGEHSGLGLHIVHRLVGELGGSIDVRTSSGHGTTFTVFLPLTPAERG